MIKVSRGVLSYNLEPVGTSRKICETSRRPKYPYQSDFVVREVLDANRGCVLLHAHRECLVHRDIVNLELVHEGVPQRPEEPIDERGRRLRVPLLPSYDPWYLVAH